MKLTPMMEQYFKIKEEHQDSIVFFRLGDFYEMFYDDAVLAAKELEITLTKRDKKNDVPMCGVPYHSAHGYIEKLIEKGYKVAIAEQMENPREVKGMVKREVVQIITPGTVMDNSLEESRSNYLLAVIPGVPFNIAYSDISTGELKVTLCDEETFFNELASIQPSEIIVPSTLPERLVKRIQPITQVITVHESEQVEIPEQAAHLKKNYLPAVQLLFNYIQATQKRDFTHIEQAQIYDAVQFMRLDMYAKRNLELTESIRLKTKQGTLLAVFNETKTPMGHRLLKEWIERPLIHQNHIDDRLQKVRLFNEYFIERDELRHALDDVYDIERLVGRISFGNVNAKDLVQLKYSLQQLPLINQILTKIGIDQVDTSHTEQIVAHLSFLNEDAPISIKEGNLFNEGFHRELDELRYASRNGKAWLNELQQKERERTGIKSLKIAYNKVFGYYIEISKANLHQFDAEANGYSRKQTLSNAERFITDELKEKEAMILGADEKAVDLEYKLFIALRDEIKKYVHELKMIARHIATLDVLQNFSEVSVKNNYVQPVFSKERELDLVDARHPVVEQVMSKSDYVPNDCHLDNQSFIYLITGPNMSGKSTYMRQVALISIMAQMGSFVPASKCTLPIFDQIFTRIGAADDLVSGQSTFMVEMMEAKNALTNATKDSLIIFDEIGRGTSTYDGLSLAQAMIEYVHHEIHAKTLFSTHYHELVALEYLDGLKNVHVAAKEYNGELIFMHKVKQGAVENSYGIHVARLADLPDEVISRAQEILSTFETPDEISKINQGRETKPAEYIQPTFDLFESQVEEKIKQLDIARMTPIDALNMLYQLQEQLK